MSPSSGIYRNIFNLNNILLKLFLMAFWVSTGIYGEETFSSNQQRISSLPSSLPSSTLPFSSSSLVLADPNFSHQSAYSPPAEPNPILASEYQQNDDEIGGNSEVLYDESSLKEEEKLKNNLINNLKIRQNLKKDEQMDGLVEKSKKEKNNFSSSESQGLIKRRQFSQYGAAQIGGMPEIPTGIAGPPGPPASACPGGPALPIECDPKRPWPQCPPQSYCYATNSVDIGPYYCCPVWSTYGAAWRPATPFYNYVPPPPPNWAEPAMQMAASPRYGPFRKNLKEQNGEENIKEEEPEEIQNTQKSLRRL
uniref:Uncharacterized protein n=1 Tax=Meloidogyne enterolobii TaxID=390850 RepID=A0A6V7UUP4_MELEN|nr:unnamed protein product [Meloidogyne enterolobii]